MIYIFFMFLLRFPVLLCDCGTCGQYGYTSGGGIKCAGRFHTSDCNQLDCLLHGKSFGEGKYSCGGKKYSVYDSVRCTGGAFNRHGGDFAGCDFPCDSACIFRSL